MSYDEQLATRVRGALARQRNVDEKKMMGGLTFMVNGKMCVGILNDDLMARIDPAVHDEAVKKKGCREMDFTGRPMKGFVFVGPEGTKTGLAGWVRLALDFNARAKASKKTKKKPARTKAR
jgi:TfoX/Sxy family transcriptional regulator of competence genes